MLNRLKRVWKFISCRHNFHFIGTVKDKEETKLVVNCEKCKLTMSVNPKEMNSLAKIHKVRVKP